MEDHDPFVGQHIMVLIIIMFLSSLIQIEYGETDAWLSMELMFHLSVLPLTRQLTNISGNLWGRTLQVSLPNAYHLKTIKK